MINKKQKLRNRWIDITLFLLVSSVLFINNMSDLFVKYGLYVHIQWITWIALIGITLYTIYQASQDEI